MVLVSEFSPSWLCRTQEQGPTRPGGGLSVEANHMVFREGLLGMASPSPRRRNLPWARSVCGWGEGGGFLSQKGFCLPLSYSLFPVAERRSSRFTGWTTRTHSASFPAWPRVGGFARARPFLSPAGEGPGLPGADARVQVAAPPSPGAGVRGAGWAPGQAVTAFPVLVRALRPEASGAGHAEHASQAKP